jgi:hypothetical protein
MSMVCDRPIFIVGTERSGSNLLRLILNTHPAIAVPHPPHIVRYLGPTEEQYGDLSKDACFRQLAQDVVRLVRAHINPWEIPIDAERLVAHAPTRTVFGLYVALYEQYREWSGKPRWGCKSTFMIEHTDTVLANFPAARIIHLVRDPRDVAASSLTSVFNPCHPYHTAHVWSAQQRLGSACLAKHPMNTRCIRYEDLVADPCATIARICEFLEETPDPAMLAFFKTEAAQRGARLCESWRRTAEPIDSASSGRYRSALSPFGIRLVEAITRPQMRQFGYQPDAPESPIADDELCRPRLRHVLLNAWLRLRIEARSLFRDTNCWRRWRRDVVVLYLNNRLRLTAVRWLQEGQGQP